MVAISLGCWRNFPRGHGCGQPPLTPHCQQLAGNWVLPGVLVQRPNNKSEDKPQAAAENAAHQPAASDAAGVTSVAMDASVVVETRVARKLDPEIAGAILPNQIQSVAEYLSKPYLVASGNWQTSNTINDLLYSANVADMILSNGMWRDKLQGYYGMRFNTVLRLTLNGTPFHAGSVRVGYYPAPETNPNKVLEHVSHFISFNQLPGVYLTPSEESVVLKVPYVSPLRFLELTAANRVSPARVEIRVFLPLSVGSSGSPSVTWNLWMSLEDVELFGQSTTIVAQSQVATSKPRIRQRGSQSEREHTPVSSFLSGLAQASAPLTSIPSLEPFVGPTQWMLNAAALSAGALGWSKPAHDDVNQRVARSNHWNMASATGTDIAQKMSLFSDNKLMVLDDATLDSADQCSIAFIKRQWAPWAAVAFSTSNTVGQQVAQFPMNPEEFRMQNLGTEYFTPVRWLTEHFQCYRGSLEFKFMFAKTAFHAGQIQFSFVPGPAVSSLAFDASPKAYRLVYDFQDSDEVCIRVPYVVPHDYMYRNESFGRLFIHVLTPLRAPETCAQSVTAMVFVRGGEDFEVAIPRLFEWTPGSITEPELVAQGGSTEVDGGLCHTMGEDDPLGSTLFSGHSQGEHVSSMLTLLKRYEQVVMPVVPEDKFAVFYPWTVFSTADARTRRSDRHSSILSCFAFMRGGVRVRFVNLSVTNKPTYFEYWNNGQALEWYNSFTLERTSDYPAFVTVSRVHYDTAGEGGAVACAYQSKYRFCPVSWNKYLIDTSPTIWHPTGTLAYRGFGTGEGADDRLMLRAFDDDFQPIFWVGIPPHRKVTPI